MPDSEIIGLILSKDERGLTELLNRYEPLIRYVITPILKSPEDVEECLSDIVMRVWDKIRLYDSSYGSFKGWLTAVSRNAALNHVAKLRRREYREELTENSPAEDPTPEEEVLRREQQERLEKIINNLMPGEKLLYYRRYYYMQPVSQIAAELGMSERSVEGRLYRLKQKLKKQFKEVTGDD